MICGLRPFEGSLALEAQTAGIINFRIVHDLEQTHFWVV
jgi:hypothetical protein